ncbi:hypothetical protein MML48_6g00004784 [Holotrichia oblita]|uniref:Uncharacterized protein n=1 Tax=Holotrichia oblita TaxID=644536 RepID=A0ACB9T042_HOLOL|nr:hypothetical protein MML48_6g00004784 [Holotrichia oblita]
MDHQVFNFIFGFVLFGAIQIAWTGNTNRGSAINHNHKRQIGGGCFYNMCNETVDYPEDEIRQLVEKTPGYKELFGTILKASRQIFIGSRNGEDEEIEEEKETNMCGTTTYYIAPKTAVDVDGVEQIVVNGNGMEQLIEYETCDEGGSCVADGQIPGYTVSCRVQEFGVIQAAWIDNNNREGTIKKHRKQQIEGGCFYNMCNITDDYPEEEIRQLIERTPAYKQLFGTVLKPKHKDEEIVEIGEYEDVEDEETNMCGTKTYYIAPKTAIDIHGVKYYVVNGDGMEQLIGYETCAENASCVAEDHIPGVIVSCRIQEIIIKLVVYTTSSSGEPALQLKSFAVPSGCYCAAKFDNFSFFRQ